MSFKKMTEGFPEKFWAVLVPMHVSKFVKFLLISQLCNSLFYPVSIFFLNSILSHTVLLVGRSRDRIPVASITGIFLVDTDRTMYRGVNSASKKWVPGIPLGVKAVGAWGWRPTTLVVPNVKKSGALTYPDSLGPSRQPVAGETFTFT